MPSLKENTLIASERKLHNPKSHAPAVYIPCWLIQVSSNLLSSSAKILYGRLSQWSTTKGTVHRSIAQLCQEVGMSPRTLERTLKELRDVELIGTYQAEAGGVNHYQFYDHPWMYEPINDHLVYHESYPHPTAKYVGIPPSNVSVPTDKCGGAKIKEIKVNNKSFCANAQKKPKSDWKEENENTHPFAESMNNKAQSKKQMEREAKNIEESEAYKKAASGMSDELWEKVKHLRYAST